MSLIVTNNVIPTVFDNINHAACLLSLSDKCFVDVNTSFKRLSGYKKEELIGNSYQDFFSEFIVEKGVSSSHQIVSFKNSKNQVVSSITHTEFVAEELILLLFTDISQLETKISGLEDLNEFFSLTDDLFCISDMNGFFLKINDRWKTTLGYCEEELLSKPFVSFIHPNDVESSLSELKNLKEGNALTESFTNRYRCADGSYKWLLWKATKINAKGVVFALAKDITKNVIDEQLIDQKDQLLTKIQQLRGLGYWTWDVEKNVVEWSDELYEIYGFTKEDFIPSFETCMSLIHPDDLQEVSGIIQKAFVNKTFMEYESKVIAKNNEIKHLRFWGGVTVNDIGEVLGMFGVGLDTTETKRREKELEQSELKFRRMFESMAEGYFMTDLRGNIKNVNPAANAILKYKKKNESLIGENVFEQFLPHVTSPDVLLHELYNKKRLKGVTTCVLNKKGQKVYLDLNIQLVGDENGSPLAIEGTFRDVTGKVKSENKIKELNNLLEEKVLQRTQQLLEANNTLKDTLGRLQDTQKKMVHQEKMASIGFLTAGLAHEINNPVNFMVAGASALDSSLSEFIKVVDAYESNLCQLNEGTQKAVSDLKTTTDYDFLKMMIPQLVQDIKMGSDRVATIVKSLRTLSSTKSEVIHQMDFVQLICSVLVLLKSKIGEVEIVLNMPKELIAFANEGQMSQVLINLLANAVDALEKQRNPKIEIKLYHRKEFLYVKVKDNGPGISKTVVKNIFDPFFTTKEVGKGTGLGLYLSYEIIKNHDGEITLTTDKGKGTQFLIKLPKKDG